MKIGFSKHIKISYRADMQTVIIRWQQPVTFTEFKMNCLAILSTAKEHTASSWLFDCRSKGEMTQLESDWLSNEFYPKALQLVSSQVLVAWLLAPRQMQRLQEGTVLSAITEDCADVRRKAFLTEDCADVRRKAFLTENEAVKWLEESVAQMEHRSNHQQ